jgi:outer membrane lipoprotein carrier protein
MTNRRILQFFGPLVLAMHLSAQSLPPVQEVAQRVDEYYNHLRSFRAQFTESYQGIGAAKSESGILLLSKPGKMRWDYKEPYPKLFLSDGKHAYFYVPGQPQAQEIATNELDDLRSPLRFLLGKTHLEAELLNLRLSSSAPAEFKLEGKPKGMEGRVRKVSLSANEAGQIQELEIEEEDGATTRFRFGGFEANPTIPAEAFHFRPPPGVTIVSGSNF